MRLTGPSASEAKLLWAENVVLLNGNVPSFRKSKVRAGVTSSATIFTSLGEILTEPQAVLGSKLRSSVFTPASVMLMFLQSGYSGRSGFGGQRSLNYSGVTVSLGLNTEQNWLMRSWACSLWFVMNFPVSLSGDTPIPTVHLALMKHQNFFLEEVGFVTSSEIRFSTCLQ